MKSKSSLITTLGVVCALVCTGWSVHAIEFRGLVDLRLGATDAERSWTRDGLDKTRFDRNAGSVGIGTGTGYHDDEKMGVVIDASGRVSSIETRGK